jgi:acetylornithine deacetylase/succinyl-diaminopimelate desuccinylase-like protein
MKKTLTLLRDLVALPSVNPAFLPTGDPRAGEQSVGEFLAGVGARAGLTVEFMEVFPGRANLLLRLTPSGKVKQRVILAPHLDTVNGADDQFVPRQSQGRLYGRGSCDTKGSVAAMLGALTEVAASGRRPCETEILFVGLIDEENSQEGSRALARSGLKADLAIVGEPTQLKVVTAHKGSLWLRLEARGRSAHGSRPDLGKNAVHAMARIIDLLETDYAAQLRRHPHPLLGPATVSVGVVQGGTQANIVPDLCRISVDRRTLPGETEASVCREIRALLRRKRLRVTCLDDKSAPCVPLETDPKLPLVAQFLRRLGQRRPAGVDYFCDAAVLAAGGIPSVAFGPGNIAQAHTRDEWVSLAQLEHAERKLTSFLRTLA